jgi:hypothetical protein
MEQSGAQTARRWPDFLKETLAVGFVAAAAFKLTYHFARVYDLVAIDDLTYIVYGSRIPVEGLPPADISPLYCLWYYLLSFIQPDRAQLISLNWTILVVLGCVSLYALVRAAGGSYATGLIAVFLALFCRALNVDPYTCHPIAIILMLGTSAAVWLRRTAWSLALLAVALLAAAYIHPSNALAFFLLCGGSAIAAAWVLIRRPRQWWQLLLPAVVVSSVAVALFWCFGNPLGGVRSFVAFAQHYGVNLALNGKLTDGTEPWAQADVVVRRDFGDAVTIAQAWKANPKQVLWHCRTNLREVPRNFALIAAPRFFTSDDAVRISIRNPMVIVGLLIVLLGGLGLVYRLRSGWGWSEYRRPILILVVLTLMLGTFAASALLVWPRLHYLMPGFLFVLGVSIAHLTYIPGLRWFWRRLQPAPALTVLGVALVIATPNQAHGWRFRQAWSRSPDNATPVLPWRATVATLKNLKIQSPIVILDWAGDTPTTYAGLSATMVWPFEKTGSFWSFVRNRNVSLIVLDQALVSSAGFRDDPEFRALAAGTRTENFTLINVPRTDIRIGVRKDLLPRAVGLLDNHSSMVDRTIARK